MTVRRYSSAISSPASDGAKLALPWARIKVRLESSLPPATWRRSGADRASRPRAGRSVRVRTRPPRRQVRHRGWPGRPVRCRCVPGRRCRRSPPVRLWRAARPRSARVARRPRQRVAGSPAIGASVLPRRRQVVAGQADRHRRPGGDLRVAGGQEPGLVPAAPRQAQDPWRRGVPGFAHNRIVYSRASGALNSRIWRGTELLDPRPARESGPRCGYCSFSSDA